MFVRLLPLAIILKCAYTQQNGAPEQCRWVSFGGSTDLNQQYAMEVCREVVTNGVTEYKMWTCDEYLPVEQTFDNDECRGNPTNQTGYPVTENAESSCANGTAVPSGPCNYFMIKRPCNNDTDFETFPVLADDCTGSLQTPERPNKFSWKWDCATDEYIEYEPSQTCNETDPAGGVSFPWDLTQFMDGCIDDNVAPFALTYGPFRPLSLCLRVDYTPQPTVDPTADPTMEPTTDPTPYPTEATNEPTEAPSEATGAPTASPEDDTPESASFINTITNYIFVILLVLFINFV